MIDSDGRDEGTGVGSLLALPLRPRTMFIGSGSKGEVLQQ
jgi:hypothetical protein